MMHPLWMAFPVLVWSLHFAAVYGFTSLACARSLADMVPWVVGASSLAAGIAAIFAFHRGVRFRDHFSGWVTAGLAALTLVAIVYETAGAYLLPLCR